MPQCVGYAKEKMKELTGIESSIRGNGADWYNSPNATKLSGIQSACVACWSGGSYGYGHVAVVESWNGNTMNYSDANYKGDEQIIYRYGITESQMKQLFGRSYTFQGYIKLK